MAHKSSGTAATPAPATVEVVVHIVKVGAQISQIPALTDAAVAKRSAIVFLIVKFKFIINNYNLQSPNILKNNQNSNYY